MSLTNEQFNSFNSMTQAEIIEDIDHRVKCGCSILEACKQIVSEQEKVEQILKVDSIRKAYQRYLNVPTFEASVPSSEQSKK